MLTRIKDRKVYLLSFLLPLCAWILIMFLFRVTPFGKNTFMISDALHQYYPFFSQYREKLLSFQSLQYSFGGGLGFDFISLWSYYLSSPLNLVITLFPKEQLALVITCLMVIKSCLAGVGFVYYLSHKGYGKDLKVVPFACGYALSSFMVGFFFDLMWMECLALFPVILAGLEKLLKEKKWKLYVVTLFLALWCNFYIAYIICVFIILWFLCYEFKDPKDFLKKGLLFAGTSILAAALAGVVLLPAFIATSGTQGGVLIPGLEWMTSYTEILAGAAGGVFTFNRPVSVTQIDYPANFYCGTFAMIFFICYFFNKNIKISRKIKLGILAILIVISFNEKCLNYIWHGFHYQVGLPNRFSFLLIFLMLVTGYTTLRDIRGFAVWRVAVPVLLVVSGLLYLYKMQPDNVTMNMLAATIALIVGYALYGICVKREWLDPGTALAVFLLVALSELVASLYFSEKSLGHVSIENYFRDSGDIHEAKAWIDEQNTEAGLYREELSNPTVANEGMAYNLNGTSIFSSMLKQDVVESMEKIGYRTTSNQINYSTGTPVINTLFGVRYILNLRQDALRIEERYQKVEQIGNVGIYENTEILPVGYMVDEAAGDLSSLTGDQFENQMELLGLMTGKAYRIFTPVPFELKDSNKVSVEKISDSAYSYLGAEESLEDNIVFETKIESDSDIYLWVAAGRYMSKTMVKINGELVAHKKMEESYYHVGEVKKGDVVTVHNQIDLAGPTYASMRMLVYAYHRDEMDRAYEDLKEEVFEVASFKQSSLEGKVHAKENGMFFTTIPYDEAWTAVVDGEKTEIIKGAGAFLSLSLDQGEHTVKFYYRTPGLREGIMLSVSAVFLMICVIVWERKRRYVNAQKQQEE